MGIRQLQTFMQKHVPQGFVDVSIKAECEEYFRKHNERPIIIIDLMSLLSIAVSDSFEALCGGRPNLYKNFYVRLFAMLTQHAELIFFEDGILVKEKVDTWFHRQDQRYKECIEILELIYRERPLDEIISQFWQIPSPATHMGILEEAAMEHGRIIVTNTTECDAEIARYATRDPRVIGVLSNDTDFLIFAGDWRYFSVNDLYVDTLVTKEYSRKAIRRHLELTDFELILLSTLNGNDVIQFEDAKIFHKSMLRGQKYWDASIRFPALARFIKRQRFGSLASDHRALTRTLAKFIYQSTNRFELTKIEESLNFYRTDFDLLELSDPLEKFCRKNNFGIVLTILRTTQFMLFVNYYDLRKEIPNYHEIIMNLSSKQIGVVLKSAGGRFQNYEALTKADHHDSYQMYELVPVMPVEQIPPVTEFLSRQEFPAHDPLRFSLLKWTIADSDKYRGCDFQSIPSNYFLDILVLVFLVKKGLLKVYEADLILLSIKHVEEGAVAAELSAPRVLNPRAFCIAHLFGKFFEYVGWSLEVTGLKELGKLINFDGVWFNILFLKYPTGFDVNELLGETAQYRLYD